MNEMPTIRLRGVRVHNLKEVEVALPLGRLTVISGVSGAGKSSLAFDTLYAEAQRRYLQSFSPYTRQFLERWDHPDADYIDALPPAIAVQPRASHGNPRATVGTRTELLDYFCLLLARVGSLFCPECGQEVRSQQPGDVVALVRSLPPGTRFSVAFPVPLGKNADLANLAADLQEAGFLRLQLGQEIIRLDELEKTPHTLPERTWVLVDRLEAGKLAWPRLNDSVETAFVHGHGQLALLLDQEERVFDRRYRCWRCDRLFLPVEPRLLNFNDPLGACPVCQGTGVKIKGRGKGRPQVSGVVCTACQGSRLSDTARAVRLKGRNLAELCALPLGELAAFWQNCTLPEKDRAACQMLLEQIQLRLACLSALQLGYLTMNRSLGTLSGGEDRRLRLANALGSNLVNALYIFEDPLAGLHPRERRAVLQELLRLRDRGNTVLAIAHQLEVMAAADQVIDLGPGAGEEGGTVVYQGPAVGLGACQTSVTGAYLSGQQFIPLPSRRRPANQGSIRLGGASRHNLKNLTVDFPLGLLCVVTGVSGAGKSSLIQQTLYPTLYRTKHHKLPPGYADPKVEATGAGQVNDVVLMDQEPLPRTARSNPATYLKVFDEIRRVFADTSEARIRNFGPAAFSFNQPGGRCETCQGQGNLTVDMQFLADITVTCPDCQGARYKRDLLNVKVRNLTMAEVLNLTVREAFRFFRAQPAIQRRLQRLLDVGLDYLRLGQATDTLSGGEGQRLKLAGHLAASRKPRCLFLLDEPTAGLHPEDVAHLLECFARLLQEGHSLIVVEHHLDVIRCADHLIDLGPEGGEAGGSLVACGTPEEVAKIADSYTGQWLRLG